MAADPQITYLILLHGDGADQVPGLWLTQSDSLTNLIRRCGLRFHSVDIYEMEPQPSWVEPQYVQWGGMKLHHVARVEPSHQWARGLNLLRDALDDFSHEQAQQVVQEGVNRLCEFLAERIQRPNTPELDASEELVELPPTPTKQENIP